MGAAEEARGGLTVLIVDDEPVNRVVLARMVELLGARWLEAASGDEALDVLREQAVDVVLMDIQMPRMSGIQTVEQLRARPGPNRQAPVVAVTGDTTRNRRDYLQLGFDDYANKPISLAAVQAMLAAKRQALMAAQTSSPYASDARYHPAR
jgi:two-component system, sensor histidine kinase